ncbi:MAG: 1-(5-phosphoribosyl)-5-[(5-phosphoribosylamino)methylideneamino]imidazole-4-carboxamide isomerase [Acidimicrobiales bacterium]
MILYPAIDLRGGRCVRLHQGDYDAETVYGDDPVAQARSFVDQGAEWLHMVDLDAALTGEPTNRAVIAEVCAAIDIPVEVGGGVRSVEAAQALFDAGVTRVVIGTAALEKPELVHELAPKHAVAVGLDARGGEVATHGWTERTGRTVGELAAEFADAGVAALVVTEISRDGTLEGPDVDGLSELLAATEIPVIASGGVGSLDHLRTLAGIEVAGRRFEGSIVGKAIYEGAFTVAEAISAINDAAINDAAINAVTEGKGDA